MSNLQNLDKLYLLFLQRRFYYSWLNKETIPKAVSFKSKNSVKQRFGTNAPKRKSNFQIFLQSIHKKDPTLDKMTFGKPKPPW